MNSKTRQDKISKIFQDKHDVLDKFSKNVTVQMNTLREELKIARSIMNQDFEKKTLSELISLRTDLRKDILARVLINNYSQSVWNGTGMYTTMHNH
ncbi:hypothetical protein CBL_07864 [Carabus blaptoides fortunei]